MKQLILQPSDIVDGIDADGNERTKRPYPFYVSQDGNIGRQDFWRSDPAKVIGFQLDLAVTQIDLHWWEAWENPAAVVGMYTVVSDEDSNWSTMLTAVASVDFV